jgi:hypothetical protein
MQVELPGRAMFDFAVPVWRRTSPLVVDGDLTDWSEAFRLPDLGAIDGSPGYAAVYLAWDGKGLYLAVDVPGKTAVAVHRQRPWTADGFFLWVDTRDVRDALRAGRFCHHFTALPRGGGPGRRRATAWQAPVQRAREQAPICDPSEIVVASSVRPDGYSLELALPAGVLNGYDPGECSRLGFTYMITDVNHRTQLWNVPPGVPFGHDPSTWAAIELVE